MSQRTVYNNSQAQVNSSNRLFIIKNSRKKKSLAIVLLSISDV